MIPSAKEAVIFISSPSYLSIVSSCLDAGISVSPSMPLSQPSMVVTARSAVLPVPVDHELRSPASARVSARVFAADISNPAFVEADTV